MSYFENTIIQQKVKSFFENVITNQRIAHAYLFYGKPGGGKTAFAFELAKTLNCIASGENPCNQCPSCVKISNAAHPDVKYIFPLARSVKEEKRAELIKQKTLNPYKSLSLTGHLNIPIETIRELKNEAKYAPFEAKKRFFIISGIEYLSREAANSFLKLLEEPPNNLLIILISNDYDSVLDTIRSRCQPVLFPAFSDNEIKTIVEPYNVPDNELMPIIRIAQNNIEEVIERIEIKEEDSRPRVVELLRSAASENWMQLNEIIESLIAQRDKNEILKFLNMAMLWISDAFHFKHTGEKENMINTDISETIIKFSEHYQGLDYQLIIEMLEKAYADIKYNLNPGLTLTNLSINLKRILTKKESV